MTNSSECCATSTIMKPIRVYVTDDDLEFRRVVSHAFRRVVNMVASRPSLEVVGMAEDIETTLSDLEKQDVDVLVLDINLGEGAAEGLEAIPDILEMRPNMKVLVVTGGGWDDYEVASVLAGAHGFLYKPFIVSDLPRAIAMLSEGKLYFAAEAQRAALAQLRAPKLANPVSLSPEDEEILESILQDVQPKDFATRLGVGIKAVYQRRFRLKCKLGLSTTRELREFAKSRAKAKPRAD